MLRREIEAMFRNVGSWNDTDFKVRLSFVKHMRGRAYGYDALVDAWIWFRDGWIASNHATIEMQVSQVNTDHPQEQLPW